LGRQLEGLTHVLQYTALKACGESEAKGIYLGLKRYGIGGFDVVWSGIDEVINCVGKE
jgi:hypothetical protein